MAAAWRSETPGLWVLDGDRDGWGQVIDDAPVRGVAVAPWDPDLVAAASDDLPFHARPSSKEYTCPGTVARRSPS